MTLPSSCCKHQYHNRELQRRDRLHDQQDQDGWNRADKRSKNGMMLVTPTTTLIRIAIGALSADIAMKHKNADNNRVNDLAVDKSAEGFVADLAEREYFFRLLRFYILPEPVFCPALRTLPCCSEYRCR